MFLKLFLLKEGFENVFYIEFKDLQNNIPDIILLKIKQILSSNFKYHINEN